MSETTDVKSRLNSLLENDFVDSFRQGIGKYLSDRITIICLTFLMLLVFISVFDQFIMPYEHDALHRTADGEIARLESPSSDHLLGTTSSGEDVFSQLIFGASSTLLTGVVGGLVIVSLGLTIGMLSGYYGGRVDSFLMRATDFAYGIPIIPTAIVLVAYFGMGFWSSVLIIGLLLWRGNARVFRSQVLQIKEREHIKAAKMLGASDWYVITRHIMPNMMGMVVLFFALGTGITILLSAGLAFLGFMDPFVPSWGVMLRGAYSSGSMTEAWWWALPPGFMISATVLSIFLLGRSYERVNEEQVNQVA